MSAYITIGMGHFDICGPDLVALQRFYAGVFGWPIASKGHGYALAATALAHGGLVAMPVVDNGWVKKATLADPAGNHLTVIQA